MWVEAGQPADTFWDQTPATFQACMAGVRKRLEHDAEERLFQAWSTGAFAGSAMGGKLKPFRHYQNRKKAQTANDMVSMLRSLGANSNMKITRVRMKEA